VSEEAGPAGETEAAVLTESDVERARWAAAAAICVAGEEKQAGMGQRWLASKQVVGLRAVVWLPAWAVAETGSEAACWLDPGLERVGSAEQDLL